MSEQSFHANGLLMTSNMKLSTRILLTYLVPCVVFTIAVVAVILQISELQRTMAQTDRATSIVQQGMSLQLHVTELQRAARGALLRVEDADPATFVEAKAGVDAALNELGKLVRDPAQIATLKRLADTAADISEATRRQFERVRAGQLEEGLKEFQTSRSEEAFRNFDRLASQFFDREQQIEIELKARSAEKVASVVQIALVCLAIAIVVSIAAGAWLARSTGDNLRRLIAGIASSSAEIATTTHQHEGAMTQQNSAVTETTATIEEMVSTARINAEQAESAAGSANAALTTTREGAALVTRNEQELQSAEEAMRLMAQQIVGLSEQAGRIGEIARLVGELAAETNMLALNAAVEAARAGDQGKGFAVVAAEIRKLADQSKKSAERANVIVNDIQKATNGMVMTAEDGSDKTLAATKTAREATRAFEEVSQLADAVHKNAQEVLLNSKQQAVALSQIDIAMKSIDNGAREITDGTSQIREGITRLSALAGEVERIL